MPSTAERIVSHVRKNPYVRVSELAREYGTSRAQVRRVLKRHDCYEDIQHEQFVEVIPAPAKVITDIEVIWADLHIPYHDPLALGIAWQYAKDLKPTSFTILGDGLDFYKASVFRKRSAEKDVFEEIERGRDFFYQWCNDFPTAHKRYFIGNHTERMELYLGEGPFEGVTSFEEAMLFDDFGVECISAKEEISLEGRPPKSGHLFYLHGHENNRWGDGLINPARQMLSKCKKNVVFGHFHRTCEHVERDIEGKPFAAWGVGCLCHLSPAYMPMNNWNHGFAVVYHYDDGTFRLDNKKIVEGMVV